MGDSRAETKTGGRPASQGIIPGDFALSVGKPERQPPSGWSWTALTDVARLESGHTPSRKRPEYWGGGVPWIGIKDATENHGRVLEDTLQHTNELGIANSSARILPRNTVCLSRTASVGYVVVMGKPMATSQDFVNWVCSDDINYQYLKYVLLSERAAFLRFASGTTHQTIYFPEVKALHVCLPPLPEQRAIAHILGTLDDKIERNRRRNQTLEAMARALFKDWFVDFGPVRTKMEGRDGQDGLVSGQRHGRGASGPTEPYLPADLWQLFPDCLDDEGKPEGWKVTTLGCVTTEIRRGISPSYLESGGVRVLNQKCIRNREINFGLARRHDPSKRKIEGRVVMAGDILVNSTGVGTLGRTAQLWRIDESTVVDSHVSVVRPNTDIVSICYLGLNLTGREAEIEMLGEGSTGQTELSRVRLGSLPVLVPPRQVLEQFDADARPLLDAIFANTVESTTLAALRDTLLPKLISGELRIADAEKLIESGHL